MPCRQLDGLNIYYEVHGQGTPIVMIRGLGGNADHRYAQTPTFSRYFKVITYDNRGIARSSDLAGGHQVLIEQPGLCNEAILDFLKRPENN